MLLDLPAGYLTTLVQSGSLLRHDGLAKDTSSIQLNTVPNREQMKISASVISVVGQNAKCSFAPERTSSNANAASEKCPAGGDTPAIGLYLPPTSMLTVVSQFTTNAQAPAGTKQAAAPLTFLVGTSEARVTL
jgi:hypothetical protein